MLCRWLFLQPLDKRDDAGASIRPLICRLWCTGCSHTAATGLHPAFPVGECGVCKLSVATKNDERAKLRTRQLPDYAQLCAMSCIMQSALPWLAQRSVVGCAGSQQRQCSTYWHALTLDNCLRICVKLLILCLLRLTCMGSLADIPAGLAHARGCVACSSVVHSRAA